jgi:hypothetical protein
MATGQSARFGGLLRRHRVLAGPAQEAPAEQAHLSAGAISALEQGVDHAPHKTRSRFWPLHSPFRRTSTAAFEAARRRPPARTGTQRGLFRSPTSRMIFAAS